MFVPSYYMDKTRNISLVLQRPKRHRNSWLLSNLLSTIDSIFWWMNEWMVGWMGIKWYHMNGSNKTVYKEHGRNDEQLWCMENHNIILFRTLRQVFVVSTSILLGDGFIANLSSVDRHLINGGVKWILNTEFHSTKTVDWHSFVALHFDKRFNVLWICLFRSFNDFRLTNK